MKNIYIVDLNLINKLITPFSKLDHHTFFYDNNDHKFIIEGYLDIQNLKSNHFTSKKEAEKFAKSFIEDKIKECKTKHDNNINHYRSKYGDDFIQYVFNCSHDERIYKHFNSLIDDDNTKYIIDHHDVLLRFNSYEPLEKFIMKEFLTYQDSLYREVFNCETKQIEKFKVFSITKV